MQRKTLESHSCLLLFFQPHHLLLRKNSPGDQKLPRAEQSSQEHGAYEQADFPEPMLKNREFVQFGVLNPPCLCDLAERPVSQVYNTVSSFFPFEIQESICPVAFELSRSSAFLSTFQDTIITSLLYLSVRDF